MATEWIDDGIVFRYGGIEFRSRHEPDAATQWGLEQSSGWWDGAEEDSPTIRQARGVRTTDTYYAPRAISWSGLLETRSRSALLGQIARFEGAFSRTLEVEEGPRNLSREASVRRVQGMITPVSDRYATYSLTVQADDPLLYSAQHVRLARNALVQNMGTTRAYPMVVVKGPTTTTPTVKIGSWSIKGTRALRSGEEMVVDCAEQILWFGGARVFPLRPGWTSIGVGARVQISASTGDAYVKRVSAWK